MCSSAVEISISSTYSVNDQTDLQGMYRRAVCKDDSIMYLFTDAQITNEKFLVFLNDLLSSGNIPDLFPQEDVDTIINDVSGKAKAAGYGTDRVSLWDFFLKNVRKNLHVVLSFAPSEEFRTRARRFPAIVNCTSIDFFHAWPQDALLSVGRRFLSTVILPEECREGVEQFMPFSFQAVNAAAKKYLAIDRRYCYTTPKSYLEPLKLYGNLLRKKRDESEKAIFRLTTGLERLKTTAQVVAGLEDNLKGMLEEAESKKEKAEGIAEVVQSEKAIVESEEAKAREEAAKCAAIQDEVTNVQRDAEEDLKNAEPLVLQAMAALDTLDKKEIGECKTMAKPPKGVDDIFAAIMVLVAGIHKNVLVQKTGRVKDRSWDAAKKQLLSNINGFMDILRNFKVYVDNFEVPNIN